MSDLGFFFFLFSVSTLDLLLGFFFSKVLQDSLDCASCSFLYWGNPSYEISDIPLSYTDVENRCLEKLVIEMCSLVDNMEKNGGGNEPPGVSGCHRFNFYFDFPTWWELEGDGMFR